MTLEIPFEEIMRAVQAHTALMAVGARHLPDERIPAILHDDHGAALRRVAKDCVAVLNTEIYLAGARELGIRIDATNVYVDYVPERDRDASPVKPDVLAHLVTQALKNMVLAIAMDACGYEHKFKDDMWRLIKMLAGTRKFSIERVAPHP